MNKIGFIGVYDKTDLIIYVARLLVEMGKSVLVIDSTINQKARYTVPAINPSEAYITEFEQIEVAVGFENYEGIRSYLGMSPGAALTYDYILVDVDTEDILKTFEIDKTCKNFFVTSFDLFSLKAGLEILSGLEEPMELMKVLFSRRATKEEDDYLNYLALGYKIKWNPERIYFPFELGDQSVIIENQIASKIKLKRLTSQFKASLVYLTGNIITESGDRELNRAFHKLERGVWNGNCNFL